MKLILNNYKNITYINVKNGLNLNNIYTVSKLNKEHKDILNFRLISLKKLIYLKFPDWVYFEMSSIKYNLIYIYSYTNLKSITDKIFNKITDTLNINKTSIIDIIINSKNINHTNQNTYILKLKLTLFKYGIIYTSFLNTSIINKYIDILNKYIGKVVPYLDNFFSAFNSCVFSEGSFIYIPKHTVCNFTLGTYFKITSDSNGQFERTLIITSVNSKLKYAEGCSAPNYYNNSQLHVAIVELFLKKNSKITYTTLQNWSKGDLNNKGGVYNLTTKRGLCFTKSNLNWVQLELGSSLTWKYPCTLLLGKYSVSDFYSLSFVSTFQIADTGSKMIHLSSNSKSSMLSKSISLDVSQNIYRGLVYISPLSYGCKNNSTCGSLLLSQNALTVTIPYIKSYNKYNTIQQEAYISTIQKNQLFFLLQRNYTLKKAINLIVNIFCSSIFTLLPNEYLTEFNILLNSKIEQLV